MLEWLKYRSYYANTANLASNKAECSTWLDLVIRVV